MALSDYPSIAEPVMANLDFLGGVSHEKAKRVHGHGTKGARNIDPTLQEHLAMAAKANNAQDLMGDPLFEAAIKDPVKRAELANNPLFQHLLPKITSLLETQSSALGSLDAKQALEIVQGMKHSDHASAGTQGKFAQLPKQEAPKF